LQAEELAPFECNPQSWEFIVIEEPKLRKELANAVAGMGWFNFNRERIHLD